MVRTRTTNGAQQNFGRCAPIPVRASARLSAELGFDEGFAFVAELEGEEVAALVKDFLGREPICDGGFDAERRCFCELSKCEGIFCGGTPSAMIWINIRFKENTWQT